MPRTAFQYLRADRSSYRESLRRKRHLGLTAACVAAALVALCVCIGLLARVMSADDAAAVDMVAAKEVAVWAALALAVALALAAFPIRSLIRARDDYEQHVETQASILNVVIEEIPESVAIWDRDFRYQLINKAFERWAGRSREAFVGRTIAEIFGEAAFAELRPKLQRALAGEQVTFEREFPDGPMRHVTSTFSPLVLPDGTIAGIIAMAHDVTAHYVEKERLESLNARDSLTGMLNRGGFESWLDDVAQAEQGRDVAVLYVDLDRFKPVNDEHGHAVGDAVLKEFARRIRTLVRPSDAVARLGGDEFAIGLKGVRALNDAQSVAAKIVAEAQRPMAVGHRVIAIGASVGVAVDATQEQDGWRGLVARADEMLYRSKRSGRARFTVHSMAAG